MKTCQSNVSEIIQCLDPVMPDSKTLVSGTWFTCQLCQEEVLTSRLLAHAKGVHDLNSEVKAVECIIKSFAVGSKASSTNDTWMMPSDHWDESQLENTDSHPGDLLSLDPQDTFDPDLDEVDEKFIDSLLNNESPSSTSSGSSISTSQNWTFFDSNNNNGHNNNNSQGAIFDLPDFPLPEAPTPVSALPSDKKCPQFRWRRRKRRSKAQYPEMSRYLLPVDSGDEIQHLGRTLECTLCGLRGKRCHLTLHFKAKHSEVIRIKKWDQQGDPLSSPPLPPPQPQSTQGAEDMNGFIKIEEDEDPDKNGSKYKVSELEDALGKAFLFLRETLDSGHSSPFELACMEKLNYPFNSLASPPSISPLTINTTHYSGAHCDF